MSKNKTLNSFLGIGTMKEWEELINDSNNTNIRSTNYFTIMTETKNKHKIIVYGKKFKGSKGPSLSLISKCSCETDTLPLLPTRAII